MAGNLRAQGYRLMGNKRLNRARWVHPEAVASLHDSWVDVTDMTDDELTAWLKA